MRRRAPFFFVLALLFIGGCAVTPRPGFVSRGFQKASSEDAHRLLESLHQGADQIQTLRVLLRGVASKGVATQSFRQVVVFERPDRLRLEFLASALNRLAVIVLVSGDLLQAIDQNGERGYIGKATLSNLSRLAAVPLEAEEMMLWLTGRFDPARYPGSSVEVFTEGQGFRYGVQLTARDGRTFVLSGERAQLTRFELFDSRGRRILDTEYEYSTPQSGAVSNLLVPSSVSFEIPARKIDVKVELDTPELNANLARVRERLFVLEIPESFETYDLDAIREVEFESPLQ